MPGRKGAWEDPERGSNTVALVAGREEGSGARPGGCSIM